MQVFSRIFNFVGYCLYALALIHFTYKGIMKIASGSVLMGVVFILMALAGAAYWYWQSRPVRWGQHMLTAVVEDYQPELAQKVYAQLCDEDKKEFAVTSELLYLALAKGNMQGAELLLKMGMEVNAPLPAYSSETTVLQTFCLEAEPDMEAIRFLLRHGANPDAGLSFPPMINALAWGNEELVQLLLQHGATPGGMGADVNPSGNTPLHSLCSGRGGDDKERAIKRITDLLQGGADVNALTTAGHTPLDVALELKGDEEKPMDESNGAMPVQDDVVALLKQHGALRGCQIRQPKPRFCGRVLLNGQLPDENQLRYLCKDEPTARVEAVNHAWMGEGLGGLVDEAAMSDEQRRAALAHTCYIEITLQEDGAVPLELGKRFARLLAAVSQAAGCVGVDFGRTVLAAEYAPHLVEHPELAMGILVQGKFRDMGKGGESLVTEGLEDMGFPEVVYTDPQPERATEVVQSVILTMLLEYGTCLEHGHRAFISPDFSLVATCEPIGPAGRMMLCIRPDTTHYRD